MCVRGRGVTRGACRRSTTQEETKKRKKEEQMPDTNDELDMLLAYADICGKQKLRTPTKKKQKYVFPARLSPFSFFPSAFPQPAHAICACLTRTCLLKMSFNVYTYPFACLSLPLQSFTFLRRPDLRARRFFLALLFSTLSSVRRCQVRDYLRFCVEM